MRRAHPISGVVEQHSGEQMNVRMSGRSSRSCSLGCEQTLDLVEQIGIYDGLMLAVIDVLAMLQSADVDRVGEQLVEHAAADAAGVI